MVYLVLDDKNMGFAIIFENPPEDIKHIEIETEEEALQYLGKIWTGMEFIKPLTEEEEEKINLKCELEYIKCLAELNSGV